jgi:L-threonylcarbamoyladenylate synthase
MKNFNTVVCMTDTVWGLVGLFNQEAYEKIYQIKSRDRDKPLILFARDLETVKKYSADWNSQIDEIAKKYWPGALTIILKRSNLLPNWLNPEFAHIGFRIPDSKSCKKIMDYSDNGLLLSTSANASGEAPIKSFQEAIDKFANQVELVLEPSDDEHFSDVASTIIKLNDNKIEILRQGSIRLEQIEQVIS